MSSLRPVGRNPVGLAVERVESELLMLEVRHHRGDRDAALPLVVAGIQAVAECACTTVHIKGEGRFANVL